MRNLLLGLAAIGFISAAPMVAAEAAQPVSGSVSSINAENNGIVKAHVLVDRWNRYVPHRHVEDNWRHDRWDYRRDFRRDFRHNRWDRRWDRRYDRRWDNNGVSGCVRVDNFGFCFN